MKRPNLTPADEFAVEDALQALRDLPPNTPVHVEALVAEDQDGETLYVRRILSPKDRVALYCREHELEESLVWIEVELSDGVELGSEIPAHDMIFLPFEAYLPYKRGSK